MKSLVVLVTLAGCAVEGDSPGHCEISGECPDMLVCAADYSCQHASDVRTVRAHWLINGVAPSQPDACDGIDEIAMGMGDDDGDGFVERAPCSAGSVLLERAPPRFRVLSGAAYRKDEVVGRSAFSVADDLHDDIFVSITVMP